ncbi:hypothetical protein COL922a_012343, partial [Colletotrichum nupharicola]
MSNQGDSQYLLDERFQVRRAETHEYISDSFNGPPIEFDDLSTISRPQSLPEDCQDERSREIVMSEAESLISNPDHGSLPNEGNEREPESDPSGQSTFSDKSGESGGWMATQDQLKRSATWGPFWLQPIVFAAFAGIFTCIAIALVMMLRYSLRHNGLFTAQPRFSYGWRFGPTA